MKITLRLFSAALLAGLLTLGSCSTSKRLSGKPSVAKQSTEDLYKQHVLANAVSTKSLTAKMRLNLSLGDKDVALSGSLKMKRGDVIQLSLTFPIVGEVGRMEFTPQEVLIVDRINSRYVRTSYDKVAFILQILTSVL